jgi:hypothetical protein
LAGDTALMRMKKKKIGPDNQYGRSGKLFTIILVIALVVLTGFDLFFPGHGYFHWDGISAFNVLYGLLACVLLFLFADLTRLLIKRDEGYYDS